AIVISVGVEVDDHIVLAVGADQLVVRGINTDRTGRIGHRRVGGQYRVHLGVGVADLIKGQIGIIAARVLHGETAGEVDTAGQYGDAGAVGVVARLHGVAEGEHPAGL